MRENKVLELSKFVRLELFKNNDEFNEWVALAAHSNYPENVPVEKVLVDDDFYAEMINALQYTQKIPDNFRITFGPPILLVLRDDDGRIVGTASIRRDEHKAHAGQINNVAIKPNYRRQGFGRFMIEQIANIVFNHSDYYHITLTTDASRNFYEKIGMNLVGILDFKEHSRYYFAKQIR